MVNKIGLSNGYFKVCKFVSNVLHFQNIGINPIIIILDFKFSNFSISSLII